MSALCRTRVGPFELSAAVALEELTADSVLSRMQPCSTAAAHLPAYACNLEEVTKVSHGMGISPRDAWVGLTEPRPEVFALVDAAAALLAIGGWDRQSPELRPRINLIAAQ